MKIVATDLRKGIVKVRIETVDDLWVLKNVIKTGDVVVGRTLRDVKIEGEGKRRLPMTLAIKVKNVYFQPFSSRLRVHGIIIEGPDGYGLKGSHHTLNIDVGSEVGIIKDAWSKAELDRLKSMSKRWVKALLIATDFDELSMAILYNQGVRYVLDRVLPGISSRDPDSIERIARMISKYVIEVVRSEEPEVIIVGSPAILRDYVANFIKEEIGGNIRVFKDSVSSGGRAGIEELIRRDVVKKLLKEVTTIEIEEVMNEFMKYLTSKPERVAYGIEDVKAAILANAVKKLLISEDLLSSDIRNLIDEMIGNVESKGGYVRIVPKECPSYLKINALGGIIAILKYDLDLNLRKAILSNK